MAIEFKDILEAFEFVSFGQIYECRAFLNKETGSIHFHSEFGDYDEELPEDIDDEKYIAIPHKIELGLGKELALDFAYQCLPNEAETIESFFRRRGAYSRFKELLEHKGLLDKWYEFESRAQAEALRSWCEANEITTHG